jgi:hypothetical protein
MMADTRKLRRPSPAGLDIAYGSWSKRDIQEAITALTAKKD